MQTKFYASGIVQFLPLPLIYTFIAFDERFAILLTAALVLAILVVRPDRQQFDRRLAIFLILLAQYPVLHLVKNTVLDASELQRVGASVTHPDLWLFAAIFIAIMATYVISTNHIGRWIAATAPSVMGVTVLAQGFQYVTQDRCRVTLWGNNVFDAPLLLTMLLLLWLAAKPRANSKTIAFLVALCIVSAASFSGARGIFLAQMALFAGLFAFAIFKRVKSLRNGMLFGVVIGLTAAIAIDFAFQCGFGARISAVAQSVDSVSAADRSANLRLIMWRTAIDYIQTAPLFGHGIGAERLAGALDHVHVHNMYLSWLIWGGILSLTSGLLFLFSILPSAIGQKRNPTQATLIASMPIFFSLSMLFDSFLVWSNFNYAFIAFIMLGFAVLTEDETQEPV